MSNERYIGKNKVVETKEVEDKILYVLENGEGNTATKEQFESMACPEQYEDGEVQIKKWNPAVGQILAILLKNDMKMIEKEFVITRIDSSITENCNKATAKLYGVENPYFVTMSMVDTILRS